MKTHERRKGQACLKLALDKTQTRLNWERETETKQKLVIRDQLPPYHTLM